ncbi:MAG TPA: phage protein Gp27 family protein, partial [Paracoccaceae bacterium]|nr:phage protein Gp27 family protein [Paracoccaceae bacterium]
MARRQIRGRHGRGRLNSIELLPDHADGAVRWAMDALAQREWPQVLILERFNEMLAELDPSVGPISSSAFNRFSMRFAAQARRLTESREMAAALAERLDDLPEGDVGLMLIETIKTLINEVLLDGMVAGESPGLKGLLDAAEAVQRLELARKANAGVAAEARKAFVKTAADAVEKAATAPARQVIGRDAPGDHGAFGQLRLRVQRQAEPFSNPPVVRAARQHQVAPAAIAPAVAGARAAIAHPPGIDVVGERRRVPQVRPPRRFRPEPRRPDLHQPVGCGVVEALDCRGEPDALVRALANDRRRPVVAPRGGAHLGRLQRRQEALSRLERRVGRRGQDRAEISLVHVATPRIS